MNKRLILKNLLRPEASKRLEDIRREEQRRGSRLGDYAKDTDIAFLLDVIDALIMSKPQLIEED